ncbi:hypothetical protein VNO77_44162 [Canavalia gladiata]|uniref:Uncharacterized protein n=1 Tax=Canavalia gladiata TaxID=3824 RepID=A0AAN9JXK0_CANGL
MISVYDFTFEMTSAFPIVLEAETGSRTIGHIEARKARLARLFVHHPLISKETILTPLESIPLFLELECAIMIVFHFPLKIGNPLTMPFLDLIKKVMLVQTQQSPPTHTHTHTPLLTSNSNPSQNQNQQENNDDDEETPLDEVLARLEALLTLLGFNQYSLLSSAVSWTAFAAVAVAAPLVALQVYDTDKNQIKVFEIGIFAFQTALAAVSLLCISHNLRKYGLNRFLFVDRHADQIPFFHRDYIQHISGSIRLIILWVLSCFLLKTVREIIRLSLIEHGSLWLSVAILLALIISWTYVSAISLSACALFHLVCNLQVIHFDDYGKLLQRESDVLIFMEEHIRLRYHLSKISHRFRIYLLLQFLVVTASQFVTLLQVTGYTGPLTFINGGDFAVSTLVQVAGIIICLHAATKISHRAQGIVSLASRWHALVTCTSSDASQLRYSASAGNLEAANHLNSIHLDYSESDLESLDYPTMPSNAQLALHMSSHHKRQAFVMYLQTNPGGITIFGWTVDRSLVNTIFFLELTLVTFVLSKTILSHECHATLPRHQVTKLGTSRSRFLTHKGHEQCLKDDASYKRNASRLPVRSYQPGSAPLNGEIHFKKRKR